MWFDEIICPVKNAMFPNNWFTKSHELNNIGHVHMPYSMEAGLISHKFLTT